MINTQIVQFYPLFHLPLSDLRSDQYSWSCYWKPAKFAENLPLFHSYSTYISQIVNLDCWGENAHKTAQCAYLSCHDTIRTQNLNSSQSRWNFKAGTAVWFQPSQKLTVLCPVWVITPTRPSWWIFWPCPEPNRIVFPDQIRIAGGLPGRVANTTHLHSLCNHII